MPTAQILPRDQLTTDGHRLVAAALQDKNNRSELVLRPIRFVSGLRHLLTLKFARRVADVVNLDAAYKSDYVPDERSGTIAEVIDAAYDFTVNRFGRRLPLGPEPLIHGVFEVFDQEIWRLAERNKRTPSSVQIALGL